MQPIVTLAKYSFMVFYVFYTSVLLLAAISLLFNYGDKSARAGNLIGLLPLFLLMSLIFALYKLQQYKTRASNNPS